MKAHFARPARENNVSSFETWIDQVNQLVRSELGMDTEHFPDRNHRDAFDVGLRPTDWAEDCIQEWTA